MIFATLKDHLVPFDLNSKKFENIKDNIQVYQFKEGLHCSFPSNFDWSLFTTIVHSYWKRSPELKNHWKVNSMILPLDPAKVADIKKWIFKGSVEIRWTMEFSEMNSDKKFIKFKIKIVSASGQEKSLSDVNWSLSELDFNFSNETWRTSEQDLIRRWLNQNLSMELIQDSSLPVLKNFMENMGIGNYKWIVCLLLFCYR